MSDQPGPLPQRIGDAERDHAAEDLREHLTMGRLDQSEFDERLTQALTARTRAELDALFADLPSPKPGAPVVTGESFPAPPWQTRSANVARPTPAQLPGRVRPNSPWGITSGVLWTVAIIFCFATNWNYWWVMLLPAFLPWWSGHRGGHPPYRRR